MAFREAIEGNVGLRRARTSLQQCATYSGRCLQSQLKEDDNHSVKVASLNASRLSMSCKLRLVFLKSNYSD